MDADFATDWNLEDASYFTKKPTSLKPNTLERLVNLPVKLPGAKKGSNKKRQDERQVSQSSKADLGANPAAESSAAATISQKPPKKKCKKERAKVHVVEQDAVQQPQQEGRPKKNRKPQQDQQDGSLPQPVPFPANTTHEPVKTKNKKEEAGKAVLAQKQAAAFQDMSQLQHQQKTSKKEVDKALGKKQVAELPGANLQQQNGTLPKKRAKRKSVDLEGEEASPSQPAGSPQALQAGPSSKGATLGMPSSSKQHSSSKEQQGQEDQHAPKQQRKQQQRKLDEQQKKKVEKQQLTPSKAEGSKSSSKKQVMEEGKMESGKKQKASADDKGAKVGGSLFDRMRAQLSGGRFRSLNEQLYTCSGEEALQLMQSDPSMFTQYHEGFQRQTESWPVHPIDQAVKWLSGRPSNLVVADFGCGDGNLAPRVKQKTHSFDLVSSAPHVTACNMASVPLDSSSIDVAVFSLALMGTDYGLFLSEAARVLRYKGWLWIAEVRSRFTQEPDEEKDVGKANSQHLQPFLKCLARLGFSLQSLDASNKMFVVMVLRKLNVPTGDPSAITWPLLRACMYRKR